MRRVEGLRSSAVISAFAVGFTAALMDGSLPITRVHDRTVELEALFRKTIPTIHKVTIHTEPESERGVAGRTRPRQTKISGEPGGIAYP